MERVVCLLICIVLHLSAQDEFIFWAELSDRDFILFHQNENVSSAMTSSAFALEEYSCHIIYTDEDLSYLQRTDLGSMDDEMPKVLKLKFLNKHKNRLTECFFGTDTKVRGIMQNHLLRNQNATYITMLPTRFRVQFHNDKALIYRLIQR